AGHRQPQAGEIEARSLGVIEKRLIKRGRSGQDRDAIAQNSLEYLRGVEHREGKAGGAAEQTSQPAGLVTERVKKRIHHEIAIVLVETDDFAPGAEDLDGLRVGGDHTLRPAGGAGSEDDIADVVGGEGGGACARGLARDRRAAGEKFTP